MCVCVCVCVCVGGWVGVWVLFVFVVVVVVVVATFARPSAVSALACEERHEDGVCGDVCGGKAE